MRLLCLFLLGVLLGPPAAAQVWGEIAGRVVDAATGEGVPGASVLVEGTRFGSAAGADGRVAFRIPEGRYGLRVSAVGYETRRDSAVVRRGLTTAFETRLEAAVVQGGEAVVEAAGEAGAGVSVLDPRTIRDMPLVLADAIRAVQTELGVTSSNELSNAFSVRGGNYDENQFFIDGHEVYRPLRISQGEQEGLGLVNGDLAERLVLFAGGFPVRYGGKLASVVEAAYARPAGAFAGTAYASTLDAGATVSGGLSRRAGLAVAVRSARPQRFFAGQELKGAYDPDFRDAQAVLDVELGPRHRLRAVGLVARQRFRFAPQQRETTFGIFPNLVRTVAIDFEGTEEDGYDIGFGGLLLQSALGRVRAEHRASVFATREFEGYDVTSRASLFRRQQRPDGPPADLDRIFEGAALQRDSADNRIRQTIATLSGRYLGGGGRHALELGWQARAVRFSDDLFETTTITGRDALRSEPVTVPVRVLESTSGLTAAQAALWAEDAVDVLPARGRLVVTPGLRAEYVGYTGEWLVAPRVGVVYRPAVTTTWTLGAGVYHQPPTYRELRGDPAPGDAAALPDDLASPRAVQAVVGLERFFPSRQLGLRAEAYAKRLSNLISYDTQNVRVNYAGENDSEGYAAGLDVQLRGELVPGLESWVNYGFLVTRERFLEPDPADFASADDLAQARARFARQGGGAWIRRPTDRRHTLTFFVQDYVPGDDTWTLHIRTLYGSSLPATAPSVAGVISEVTVFQPGVRHATTLPSYLRFDLGATKRLRVGRAVAGGPLALSATVEVLNVFDDTNVVAQTWVEQREGGRRTFVAVPTRLTPRTLNVRVRLDF